MQSNCMRSEVAIRLCGSTASVEQEHLGWKQKGDERELSRQCQCGDSGQRALEKNTVSDVKQRTGQKIHDNEVTGQTARRAVDVHTNCARSITTSESADPVVNRGTADEVTSSDPVISSDMTVELQTLSNGSHACGESQ